MLCQNERVSVLFKAAFRTPATTQKPLGSNVFLQRRTALISSPPHHITLRHLLMSDGRDQKLFAWDCCFFSVFLAPLCIQSLRPTGLSGVQDLSCCYKWFLFHFYWVLCLKPFWTHLQPLLWKRFSFSRTYCSMGRSVVQSYNSPTRSYCINIIYCTNALSLRVPHLIHYKKDLELNYPRQNVIYHHGSSWDSICCSTNVWWK